ncbi:MAG: putative sugar O-methyltransferase [Parachlamydiaceae bacterium]
MQILPLSIRLFFVVILTAMGMIPVHLRANQNTLAVSRFHGHNSKSTSAQKKIKDNISFDDYLHFCKQASTDEAVFCNFRSHPIYRKYFDLFSKEEGDACVGYIFDKGSNIANDIDKFRDSDAIGKPITYRYCYGYFSPMTLHNIKVTSVLQQRFGDLSRMHIAEIGGGYGGLCKILADSTGFASYTFIDRPEVNALAKKFLSLYNIANVSFIDSIDDIPTQSYDLLICDHAFFPSDNAGKENLINTVMASSKNGYIRTGGPNENLPSFSVEEILGVLYRNGKNGKVEKDHYSAGPNKTLVTWSSLPSVSLAFDRRETSLRATGNALTYSFSEGRLGDCFVCYLHAKWLAYKYDLPFYYVPFKFSDQFSLSDIEQEVESMAKFSNTICLREENNISQHSNTLITVPYFPECKVEYESRGYSKTILSFKVDWDDSGFRAEIFRCLRLKNHVNSIDFPKNYITVGVHVRRGGGFDSPTQVKKFPLKFPPDEYYIEQLKSISKIFRDEKIYVYILTDDSNPVAIKDKYAAEVCNENMVFDSRHQGNDFRSTDLDDFHLLQQFDCLILCQSNFSLVASKLADYRILFTPLNFVINCRKTPVIDEVEICVKPKR